MWPIVLHNNHATEDWPLGKIRCEIMEMRSPLHSLRIAEDERFWTTEAEKKRFFSNLSIKIGRISGEYNGFFVYLSYGDSGEPPYFETDAYEDAVITNFRLKNVPITKDMGEEPGYPIRENFSKEIVAYIPKRTVEEYVSILQREWGRDIPVVDKIKQWPLIKYRAPDEKKVHNRMAFSFLMQSTGLSLKTAASYLKMKENSLRKMLEGKSDVSDRMLKSLEELEREIKSHAADICTKIEAVSDSEVDILISETEEGHSLAKVYGIEPPCKISINGEDVTPFTYPNNLGVWSINAFRSILGRVIGATEKRINVKEIPWSQQK